MSNSSNLERGYQLFEMGRYQDAIPYLKNAISEDAEDYEIKYLLAQAYFQIGDLKKSKILASNLRSEAPNYTYAYFILSQINGFEDKLDDAMKNINQAINLDPYEDSFFGQKASIFIEKKDFNSALEYADEGLKIDPKSEFCLNVRATALTKLNRKREAEETIENLLQDNPDNAYSHANVGWSHLENNNTSEALNHFKEALKLDPNSDHAREGMLTAVKSKNKIYNLYLRYAFWISKKSERNQWFFIIGIYIAYRFSVKILSAAGLTFLSIPLVIAYLLFALGSWIIDPLSNMILLFDNYGKYLLDKDEKTSGQIFFGLILLAIIAFSLSFIISSNYVILLCITSLAAILPLTRSPLSNTEKSKNIGYTYGIIMFAISIFGMVLGYEYVTLLIIVLLMFVAYTWFGNFILKM